MYIILAILLLAILIVVHEFGHFTAARIMKIDVNEFSVGFGPRLLKWKSRKHGTDFSVRAIPLGGYCAFFGEDDAKGVTKDDPRAFANQNVWKRMFVILMGPMMNFVLAFLVAAVFYWCSGIQVPAEGELYDSVLTGVVASSPAEQAGLKARDMIMEVNGVNVQDGGTETLVSALGGWQEGDEPMLLTVKRGNETFETRVTPEFDEDEQRMMIGIQIGFRLRTVSKPVGFLEGFGCAWDICVYEGGMILRLLKDLVTTGQGFDQTAGPVGIVSIVSEEVQTYGAGAFFDLLVQISINLGLMNLLPIPGLDGSRLVFGLIEVIRRKPVPPEKEAIVHLTGMVLLFGLLIFFTFRDVSRLFGG